jgi:murein DD-endopeptidase MepM/ murein hydrolase activator NlpD
VNLRDKKEFIKYVNETISKARRKFGEGGYGEDRIIYRRSDIFENEAEPRSVHLAADIWLPAGTPIFSPLPAVIHSFRDNNNFGDYGPTIILKHKLDNVIFYTLYGHLSRKSLAKIKKGMKIKQGQKIATVGRYNENGNWPPHVHFQIITDMLGKQGDFPGVAKPSQKKYYLTLCPDPGLILR